MYVLWISIISSTVVAVCMLTCMVVVAELIVVVMM